MATAEPRICHICSAITSSRGFCHSCGHAMCPTCVCNIPADAGDTHEAFPTNDRTHKAMFGGVKYTSHDRTPPNEPATPEYASAAQSILIKPEDVKSQISSGGSVRQAPRLYFLPWFHSMKQLDGSLAKNPFIITDQQTAQGPGQVGLATETSERAALSEVRHMSRWHGIDVKPLAEPLRKFQHRQAEDHKGTEGEEARYSLRPEAVKIWPKLASPVRSKPSTQTMKPQQEERGHVQSVGSKNRPGSGYVVTEPGVIRTLDSMQAREMLPKKTKRLVVPVDARSNSCCSTDERPLPEAMEGPAMQKIERDKSLAETDGCPVKAVNGTHIVDSSSPLKRLQDASGRATEALTVERFMTTFQIQSDQRFGKKRERPMSPESRIRREANSLGLRRQSRGPGHRDAFIIFSKGVDSRQDTEAITTLADEVKSKQRLVTSHDAERSLVIPQLKPHKQHLQKELRQTIKRRDKEVSGVLDEISDQSGPQTLEQMPQKHELTPAALFSGADHDKKYRTTVAKPKQRIAGLETYSEDKSRFKEPLEAVHQQHQHRTMSISGVEDDNEVHVYYDDNHDCVWKTRYLALSAEVHQLREMMSERAPISSSSAEAIASGIEDIGSNFGLEGVTFVMHLKGKHDLVINTDLRER